MEQELKLPNGGLTPERAEGASPKPAPAAEPAPVATPPESPKKKRRSRTIVIVAALLALLAAAVVLHRLGFYKYPWEHYVPVPIVAGDLFPGASADAIEGYLANMTVDEIREQMQRVADEGYFSFKINARPVFENGKAAGNLEIENPSYNTYPMVVQIFLDDTEEMIFDSGGILPDHHIDNAELLTVLKAGTYNATAYLNAYDPVSLEWQGKSAAGLIITVQN
jgi:hypothetical protein